MAVSYTEQPEDLTFQALETIHHHELHMVSGFLES